MRFDPFGWLARWIDPAHLHFAIRAGAVAVAAFFLVRRAMAYSSFASKPLWAIETLVFLVVLLAYLLRVDPRDRSTGWREIGVPLVGAALPFALLLTPPHPAIPADTLANAVIFWLMTFGTALTVCGIWTLRRAFSITVEARELVSSGPYRLIRHPVYAGEMLTATAVTAWRFSWINLMLLAAFIAIQLLRARWEEQKLARALPGYGEFARGSRWFWRGPTEPRKDPG